jgi:hypothetical protein
MGSSWNSSVLIIRYAQQGDELRTSIVSFLSTSCMWHRPPAQLCLVRNKCGVRLNQPLSIFLPWRNPWNNFQGSRNPCIKIIIPTAHGTLAWSVSCRYNNPIIIANALLSREWHFSVDLFILANKLKNNMFIFFNHDLSRNPGWETLV